MKSQVTSPTSETSEDAVKGKDSRSTIYESRSIGVREFGLTKDQVMHPQFTEETLANMIRLRVQGRANTNEEAYQMMDGLKPDQIVAVVNSGYTKEYFAARIDSRTNQSYKTEKPLPSLEGLKSDSNKSSDQRTETTTSKDLNSFLKIQNTAASKPLGEQVASNKDSQTSQNSPDRKRSKKGI
ncbi:hypothetical protein [Ascidiimonas sp. W6]|uniref:hypothetical protein n=1 Tax=Ascidiimonas meishanensis TaxID=3128903 RepID=UPI0030EE50E1